MGEGKYIIIAGAGKVGWNLARELLEKGNEVTVIEDDRNRFATVEQELEHNIQYGDASELWVLERAGISRADMVIAVTGDDEDNMLICQVAKEKYLVDRIIARVNNPRNRSHFELLGIKPYVSATDLILRLLEHEVPEYGLVHLLDLPEERLEIIEMLLVDDSRVAGQKVGDLNMPEGSLLISILREGQGGFVPTPDTVLEAGDEVLAGRPPGKKSGPADTNVEDEKGQIPADRRLCLRLRRCRAAQARRRWRHPAGRPGAGSAVRAATALQGVPARGGQARGRLRQSPRLVRGERRGVADGHERDVARRRGADGQVAGRRRGELRESAARHRREREPASGRRLEPRPHPLPAGVRELGQHQGGRGEGGSGGAGRRQLHRLRGGGVPEVEGNRLRDRDDGGRGAVSDLRRGAGALVPRAAGVEGDRDPRRRDPCGVRGR